LTARQRLTSIVAMALLLLPAARAIAAKVVIQALIIGNNQPLPTGKPVISATVAPLRFADDDAAAMYQLLAPIADGAHLLTVMDAETQAVFPDLAAIARPPSVEAVQTAVAQIAERIKATQARGETSVVFVFYSGHGSRVDGDGERQLTLQDGGITRLFLYREILDKLSANYVHLIVDACHAEEVVRPRDTDGQVVDIASSDAERLLSRPTLAHYPQVGTIIAATSSAQTHEWDLIRHGIFTFELLSALRGAADVNHDHLVEYSETAAFLSAANRSIPDSRVRLEVIASPPPVNRRVALVDLTQLANAGNVLLSGILSSAGRVEVIDHKGRHLASTRGESGFSSEMVLPADQRIYVQVGDGREARISTAPGQMISFDGLKFEPPANRQRGAIEDAIHDGLFATAFGRGYYTGFVDRDADFISVEFDSTSLARAPPLDAVVRTADDGTAVPKTNAILLVEGGIATPVARDFVTSQGARLGLRPRQYRGAAFSVDLLRASGPHDSEWATTLSAGWLWEVSRGPIHTWMGGIIGAGAMVQTSAGQAIRWSGLVTAGPMIATSVPLTDHVAVWTEGQLCARGYRSDGAFTISLAPSVWLGMALVL
jgi:hypothetical protein